MTMAAVTKLKSMPGFPYSQSAFHNTEKLPKELPDDYETRTWKNRLHVTGEGNVFIPAMAFKNCLAEAAKFLSIKIPGKGNATFTKHIEAGVLVLEDADIGISADEVEGEWFFVPSDGRRGGGKRVKKCFPRIDQWEAEVTFHIIDETVTKSAFKEHLEAAGKFIGIGRFRPRNNGNYGRFTVEKIKWIEG